MYQSISGLMAKLGVSEVTNAPSTSSQVIEHGMDPGLDLDAIIRFVHTQSPLTLQVIWCPGLGQSIPHGPKCGVRFRQLVSILARCAGQHLRIPRIGR